MKKLSTLVDWLATNWTLWALGGVAVLALVGFKASSQLFPRMPKPPVFSRIQQLQQGASGPGESGRRDWTADQRHLYYQTSQGSMVMPYRWFMALEHGTGTEMFASPAVQATFGLLPDNSGRFNPDQLPIGIVKETVDTKYVNLLSYGIQDWASLSCAACHTGQFTYKGVAARIDGGQSFFNFQQWSQDMVFSIMLTTSSPAKFGRFCSRLQGRGPTGTCTDAEKRKLLAEVQAYYKSPLITGALADSVSMAYPTDEGFGRTNALGRGVNGEFAPLDVANGRPNTGSVSFPPLWYTHDYDWLQSSSAIGQPLGRNVTESWGVNVAVDLDISHEKTTLFASSHKITDMFWMETLLSTLGAPKWPEELLGKIDTARAARGKALYEDAVWDKALKAEDAELGPPDPANYILGPNPKRPTKGYCARCHAPALSDAATLYGKGAYAPERTYVQLPLYKMSVMGTDPDDALQFGVRPLMKTGQLAPLFKGLPGVTNPSEVGIGTALTVTTTGIMDYWFKENKVAGLCRQIIEGFRPNEFRAPPAYPARPLDGYWATGPFLHNGSVRTMYELLSPVSERAKTFYQGSQEFDPVNLGYVNDSVEGAFVFNTAKRGNSNAGHEFRDAPAGTPGVIGPLLTHEQRLDILEYMKQLDQVPQMTNELMPQRWALMDTMAPYYETKDGSASYDTGMEPFCQAITSAYEKSIKAEPPAAPPTTVKSKD